MSGEPRTAAGRALLRYDSVDSGPGDIEQLRRAILAIEAEARSETPAEGLREAYGGHPEFGPRFVANTASPSIAGWEALARDALAAFDECRAALTEAPPSEPEPES